MKLARAAVEATFTDVANAVEISQHGCIYRARKWQLTPELVEVIDMAVEFGFSAFWVNGHPSKSYLNGGPLFMRGSHHITFARSHEEKWVFVVDGSAGPPVPRDITFKRDLRDFLERVGQAHAWEHAGGHNLRVPRDRLRYVLERLDHGLVDQMHLPRSAERYFGAQVVGDIYREQDLQSRLERDWGPLVAAAGHLLDARLSIDGSIPDLVLRCSNADTLVIELKFSHAGGVELDQLQKYLTVQRMQQEPRVGRLHGVLVARDFSAQLIDQANAAMSSFSLYAFGQCDGALRLHFVGGQDVLGPLGLDLRNG